MKFDWTGNLLSGVIGALLATLVISFGAARGWWS